MKVQTVALTSAALVRETSVNRRTSHVSYANTATSCVLVSTKNLGFLGFELRVRRGPRVAFRHTLTADDEIGQYTEPGHDDNGEYP